MKFRKKPVVVDAMRFGGIADAVNAESLDSLVAFDAWVDENKGHRKVRYRGNYLLIETLEGTMTAKPGDWIIRGVHGELYPCKPDIFEATYELADQA